MKLLRRILALVIGSLGGLLLVVFGIPIGIGVALLCLGEWLWGQEPVKPYVPSPPDYESKWEVVVEPLGGISLYRNGNRYTTQHSVVTLAHSGCSFEVVPPAFMEELRARLEVLDLLREWEDARVVGGSRAWLDRLAVDSAKVLENPSVMGPLEQQLDRLVREHIERFRGLA